MKKYVVVYKRKKYIKVATAIGSKFYRILVVICLLFSCIAINAKTIRVFTGNIQRVEKTVRIDGNTYFLTLKDGTMYQLEDEKQYSIVLESWNPIKFSSPPSHPSRMVTICLIGVFCEQIKKSLIFTLFTPSQSPQFTLSQSATFASTLSILAN